MRPLANASERASRTVIAAIKSYIDPNQKNWDLMLNQIGRALVFKIFNRQHFQNNLKFPPVFKICRQKFKWPNKLKNSSSSQHWKFNQCCHLASTLKNLFKFNLNIPVEVYVRLCNLVKGSVLSVAFAAPTYKQHSTPSVAPTYKQQWTHCRTYIQTT